MSEITVAEVKTALNKTLSVDDAELQTMIDAAEAEYVEYVGPMPGTVTETVSGGSTSVVLRSEYVTAVTAAAYSDGTTISTSDLVLDARSGIVYWGYGTAGYFIPGTRNVTLTYTVGALPVNHRQVIIADVAGYFEATQRGPLGPDDTGYSNAYTATPTVLFPRIRALAPPRVA